MSLRMATRLVVYLVLTTLLAEANIKDPNSRNEEMNKAVINDITLKNKEKRLYKRKVCTINKDIKPTDNSDHKYIYPGGTTPKPNYRPYKIHENVDDIPDNRTRPGPIVPDYAPKQPLNTVPPTNGEETTTVEATEDKKKNKKTKTSVQNEEYGEKDDIDKELKSIYTNIKDYLIEVLSFFNKGAVEERRKRSIDDQQSMSRFGYVQNRNNLDDTNSNVRRRHKNLI